MALAIDGSVTVNSSAGVTSLALPGLTTTGTNEIIIVYALSNGVGVSSVTSSSLTFTSRAVSGAGNVISEYYAVASSILSSEVITVNFAGSSGFVTLSAFGVSGGNVSSPFDANGSLPSVSVPGLVSTTNASTMVIAGSRMNSTPSPTAGSGFTQILGANYLLVEYVLVATQQASLQITATSGLNDENGTVGDALVEALGVTMAWHAPMISRWR